MAHGGEAMLAGAFHGKAGIGELREPPEELLQPFCGVGKSTGFQQGTVHVQGGSSVVARMGVYAYNAHASPRIGGVRPGLRTPEAWSHVAPLYPATGWANLGAWWATRPQSGYYPKGGNGPHHAPPILPYLPTSLPILSYRVGTTSVAMPSPSPGNPNRSCAKGFAGREP